MDLKSNFSIMDMTQPKVEYFMDTCRKPEKAADRGDSCVKSGCCPCSEPCARYLMMWRMATDSAAEATRFLRRRGIARV